MENIKEYRVMFIVDSIIEFKDHLRMVPQYEKTEKKPLRGQI